MTAIDVRPAVASDAAFIRRTLEASWGATMVAVHGELIDAATQSVLIARDAEHRRVGLLTYRAEPSDVAWEIVSLDATTPGVGVGTALISALRSQARQSGVQRLWLVTTNDNTDALRFYQRRGFDLAALHRDAVTVARRLKPAIPQLSNGIPLRHELVLDMRP
ncbi:GNAT family N-acetyltransferase [Solihabitans fulvus]|uniref:GNAT family N-acetyltransferase n=1 Tax=Solihabitans fulvus TaxID=1892852 RepID=UPI0016620205|nr:GNAT family N-acetyltransferase [Solihabitans fulvus]